MMEEIKYGGIALSAILAAILGLVYKAAGDKIPDKWRALIAVGCGIPFGILYIPYNGLEWNTINIVDYAIAGFMIGLSSVGWYESQKTFTAPRGGKV